MTDQQINEAIAEACGWTDVHFSLAATDEWPTERRIVGIPPTHCTHDVAPNYCSDLNAMHEAEKTLIEGFEDEPESSELWSDYQTNLIIACPAYLSYHATARQRAEAFLLTLGKWSATNKESLTVAATTEKSSADQKEVQG